MQKGKAVCTEKTKSKLQVICSLMQAVNILVESKEFTCEVRDF